MAKKSKKLSKKDLSNLEVVVNKKGGFSIWTIEQTVSDGQKKYQRHWIIDGSCFKDDGIIRLGNNNIWKINAKFDEKENYIVITKD